MGHRRSVLTVLLLGVILAVISGCFALQNSPPVARFTCDPSSGISSLMVSFSAWDSYDSDGRIVSYEWDFGDGDTDTGLWTIHTYTVSAHTQFTVTLTVTDDNGASSSTTRTVAVSPALEILSGSTGSSFRQPIWLPPPIGVYYVAIPLHALRFHNWRDS